MVAPALLIHDKALERHEACNKIAARFLTDLAAQYAKENPS